MKNVSTHARTIGAKIFLTRHHQGISLRGLAEKTGFSYSYLNRIEKGKTMAKAETLDNVLKVLGSPMKENKTWDTWFIEDYLPKVYNYIYFSQYDKARKMYHELRPYHDYFISSFYFIDYYLVMCSMIVMTHIAYDKTDHYLKTCQLLESFMTDEQKEIFILNQSHYYMFNKAFTVAQNYLKPKLGSFKNSQIQARAYYLIAVSLTNNYTQYNQAMLYYEKAKDIFDAHMNFDRSNRTKTMQLRLFAYLQQQDKFNETLADVSEYAISNQAGNMYSLIQVHLALSHIMHERYQDAIDVLSLFTMDEGAYYFLKAYAYMRLNQSMEAMDIIQKVKQSAAIFSFNLEAIGFRIFEQLLLRKINKTILNDLKSYCDQAHQEKDLLMVQIATTLYVEQLKAKRAYKEAYNYTEKYLRVLFAIVH